MKSLYNKKLCYFLKIDSNKEYHINDILMLLNKYKYNDEGYLIHDKLINIFRENNITINWKYVDSKYFKKLISSLQIKQNKFISKFKFNDVGVLVNEICI
jgi:hypothetical protein|tara:strand:+ start:1159 stop:1458 length:300 start_codon:yes stop_codon:yes gene_type:complete